MKPSKIVDDMIIPLEFQVDKEHHFCFVVFSSRERHKEVIIDYVRRAIPEEDNFKIKRLDKSLKSEDSQYEGLTDLLKKCSFAIVILDGLRPNVLFEYGVLKGLGKPCIVLLEENAKIDVINYLEEDDQKKINNPKVDMDNNFSDVKDRFYVRYDKNDPKGSIQKIRKEYLKLKDGIHEELMQMIFPNKGYVEKEIKDRLDDLLIIFKKRENQLKRQDEIKFKTIKKEIDEIAKKHNLKLSKKYSLMIIDIFLNFNRYKEALEIIDSIVQNKKEDIDLISLKARIFTKNERYNDAIETMDTAIRLNPKLEGLWHDKGLILELMEHKDEAKLCYKKGIKFNKNCSSIYFDYGLMLYEGDQFQDALDQFQMALEMDSSNSDFLVWKARAIAKLGDNKEAKKVIEDAICFDDKNPNAWYTYGTIMGDLKNYKEAIKYFDKTLSIEPRYDSALCSKASTLSNSGKTDEALEIFDKMNEVCDRYESCETIRHSLAVTFWKKQKYKEALNYVNEAIKINKKNSVLILLKADILCIDLKKIDEGLNLYKKALKLNPNNANTWYNQSCAFARLNKIDESIKSLKKAIELDSKFKEEMKDDPDFNGIRNNDKFKKEFN